MNRGLLVLVAAMILAGRFSWAESKKEGAVPAVDAPQTIKPLAAEGNMSVILKDADMDYDEIRWEGYDCRKDGHMMIPLAVFQKGKWLSHYDKALAGPIRTDNCFVEMNDPARHHTATKDTPACSGKDDCRVFAFHDINCPTGERTDLLQTNFHTLISKPAWQSAMHPIAKPPSVDKLAARMKEELKPLEEEGRRISRGNSQFGRLCKSCPYDPDKLLPPEVTEAIEFELAPGEPAVFITLHRRFPCKETGYEGTPLSKSAQNLYNSSNWHTIVRKDTLEPLWSKGWTYWNEKTCWKFRLMGAADINGDGITEVVIAASGYENDLYYLFEYRGKKLVLLF